MDDILLERCRSFLKGIPQTLNYITSKDLYSMLQTNPDDVFILDNRTPEFYQKGHVPHAVNIPLRDALDEEQIAKLPKDKLIVVCCWVGHTASQLLTVLRLLGYNAVGLKYGMGEPAKIEEKREGWLDLGLPVESATHS